MSNKTQFPIVFYPAVRVIALVTISSLLATGLGLVETIHSSRYVWLTLVAVGSAVSLVGIVLIVKRSPSAVLERDHLKFRRGVKYVHLQYSDLAGLTLVDPGATGRLAISTRSGHTIEWGQASFRDSLSDVGQRIAEVAGIDLREDGT